ncbi:TetR/AcrR family transcriptional regulator [Erythrobacter sp. HA6-11]
MGLKPVEIEASELPPTRKGKATREKLLQAAAVVFGRLGYSATRIADIVAEAGISHGLFYRHFADKDAILLAVIERLNDDLRHTSGRSVGEQNTFSLTQMEQRNIQFFREYRQNRLLLRVTREAAALGEETGFRDVWLTIRSRFVERTERWLTQLVEDKVIEPIADIAMVAESLSALTEQLAYVQIGLAKSDPDDAFIERLGKACGLVWYRTISGQPA